MVRKIYHIMHKRLDGTQTLQYEPECWARSDSESSDLFQKVKSLSTNFLVWGADFFCDWIDYFDFIRLE
jgi:hypothetical protein